MKPYHRIGLFYAWCLGCLGLFGCEGTVGIQTGPPEQVKAQILQQWRQRAEQAVPFAASGNSRHGIVDADGDIQHLNFTAKLWFDPPQSLRVQSHATLHGNIDLGCNDEEFWLAVKPEVSTYYWGRWDQSLQEGLMPFSPQIVLEGIGLVLVGEDADWHFDEDEDYWILSQPQTQMNLTKRIYVSRATGQIARLLYVDEEETPWVAAELSGFRTIAPDFAVPTVIKVTAWENGEMVGWVKLVAQSFRKRPVRESVFKRLPSKGFEHVYEVTQAVSTD